MIPSTSASRDDALRLARTDLSKAMNEAGNIKELEERSNTRGNVIEVWIKTNKNFNAFLAAALQVSCIELPKDQSHALARIVRKSKEAGFTEEECKSIQQDVVSARKKLGLDLKPDLDPIQYADKREEETEKFRTLAMNAPSAPEALYFAAQCPNHKPQILPEVVAKFGLENVRCSQNDNRKGIFKEKLITLSAEALEADLIEKPKARNKALNKIAYEYTSMGMLDKALDILKTLTDREILEKAIDPDHSIGRLVVILAPERMPEFASLLTEKK